MDQIYRDRNAALADDLDSGRYIQGHGVLHRVITLPDGSTREEWCCLGVASDRASADGVPVTRQMIQYTVNEDNESFGPFGTFTSFPARAIGAYYGWESANPYLLAENGKMIQASLLNDQGDAPWNGWYYDFPRIAAAFRRTFCEE